jgi:hypothetical protein
MGRGCHDNEARRESEIRYHQVIIYVEDENALSLTNLTVIMRMAISKQIFPNMIHSRTEHNSGKTKYADKSHAQESWLCH